VSVRYDQLTPTDSSVGETLSRRVTLLTWLQLGLVVLLGTGIVVILLAMTPGESARSFYLVMVAGMLALTLCGLAVNRSGHYRIASGLTIMAVATPPWLALLVDVHVRSGDLMPLTYVVLSILLTALLLNTSFTLMVAGIQWVALLVLSFTLPDSGFNWASLLTMVFCLSVLAALYTIVTGRDGTQIRHQADEIRQDQRALQDRLTQLETEIARREEAELGLQRRNEALQQFVYMASHDLREPLRAIQGFGELMAVEVEQPTAAFDEAAEEVRSAVLRMRALIDDLLQLSRVETASVVEVVDVAAAVAVVVSDLSLLIEEHAAEVEVTVAPGLHIEAPPVHVRSLLQNLISNAVKYHPDQRGNHVQVHVDPQPPGTRVVVADDGLGVAKEDQERMFQPFVRLDKRVRDGSGVGLAVVDRIVRAAQGTATVAGAETSGLTVVTYLPRWSIVAESS